MHHSIWPSTMTLFIAATWLNKQNNLSNWQWVSYQSTHSIIHQSINTTTEQMAIQLTGKEAISLNLWPKRRHRHWGRIQGDGRKFVDSFKSYFGSQISSQSLNEVHMYPLQPKSATKGMCFFPHFCLWLFPVRACCPLTFWPCHVCNLYSG